MVCLVMAPLHTLVHRQIEQTTSFGGSAEQPASQTPAAQTNLPQHITTSLLLHIMSLQASQHINLQRNQLVKQRFDHEIANDVLRGTQAQLSTGIVG